MPALRYATAAAALSRAWRESAADGQFRFVLLARAHSRGSKSPHELITANEAKQMTAKQKPSAVPLVERDEAPEITVAWVREADLYEGPRLVKRGRSPTQVHKAPVTLRLDPQALALWRASGKGWQTRAAALLAERAPK